MIELDRDFDREQFIQPAAFVMRFSPIDQDNGESPCDLIYLSEGEGVVFYQKGTHVKNSLYGFFIHIPIDYFSEEMEVFIRFEGGKVKILTGIDDIGFKQCRQKEKEIIDIRMNLTRGSSYRILAGKNFNSVQKEWYEHVLPRFN